MKAICFIPRHPIQRNATTYLYFRLCILDSLDESCTIKEKARLNLHSVGFVTYWMMIKRLTILLEVI